MNDDFHINESQLEQLVRALAQNDASRLSRIEKLKTCYQQFSTSVTFKPGDIVTWKPELRNKQRPDYGEPAIVLEVLDKPIFDRTDDSGSPYFREPLDICLGILMEDGDFVSFMFDSRRLCHFNRLS